MMISRLSLRALITALLVAVILLTTLHTLVAKYQFRRVALDYRITSLSRVIEVATLEVLRQARGHAIALGTTVQQRLRLEDRDSLRAQLDEPFVKGYVEVAYLDLVMLRAYDNDLRLLGASSQQALPPLPPMLIAQAAAREGADRLKALGGLWHAPAGPLYSVLVPVGGLHVEGYLEVVFDPMFNLYKVSDMIGMPLGIDGPRGEPLRLPANIDPTAPRYTAVKYALRDVAGAVVLSLTVYEDADLLYSDLHRTQMLITASFIVFTSALLALALWLLQRYLFHPVHTMIAEMEHALHDENDTKVTGRGIREVHIVAAAFNTMASRVRATIQELHRLSALDGLTGIANRRTFDMMLEREWLRALRQGNPISLLLLDLDYFKQYNDHYGHQAGDECLKHIARALTLAVHRPADVVARYGGEEFVILLPDTDEAGAVGVAQKLQQIVATLAIPHAAVDSGKIITMSIGICSLTPEGGATSQQLIACADRALYRAKAAGRNRIELGHTSNLNADGQEGFNSPGNS